MKRALVILLLYACTFTNAQNQRKVDSLLNELKSFEAQKLALGVNAPMMMDTTKVLLLNELNREWREFDNKRGLEYARQCLELSEKIGYKKGLAHAYNDYGTYYLYDSKYDDAENYYNKSLSIRREIHDSDGISSCYNNLGYVYRSKGDDARGILSYQTSLQYSEASNNKRMMATTYHNMGLLYAEAGNMHAALESYLKASSINREVGNSIYLSYNLGGLLGVLENLKQYEKVIVAAKELIQLNELYHKRSSDQLATIGYMYVKLHQDNEALKYFELVAKEASSARDTNWLTQIKLDFARVYRRQNRLQDAQRCLRTAIAYADIAKRPDLKRESYDELAEVQGKLGDYRGAWQSHLAAQVLKDTTDNSAQDKDKVNKLTRALVQVNYDKQRDSTQSAHEKRDAVQSTIRSSILAVLAGCVVFLVIVYRQRNRIRNANAKNEELLLNILPSEVADELKAKGKAEARQFDNVTVLFTDFKSFTTVSEQLTPQELVSELDACFAAFDEICGTYNIEKIKTIGDAYLAACGLPVAVADHAERVVRAALDIRDFVAMRLKTHGEKTFNIRIGIHSGSVVAGIVGVKKYSYDIWGDTVNTAARMEQSSEPGKVNISHSTYELVKDRFACMNRGEIDAKNKGKLKMYFVEKL